MIEEIVLNNINNQFEFKRKMQLITQWQRLIICLYILGFSCAEIAQRSGYTKQAISHQFREAKRKMGI